ncbi:cysteine desulfurase, partial [Brucella abortus]
MTETGFSFSSGFIGRSWLKIQENCDFRYLEGVVKEIGKVVGSGKRLYLDYNASAPLLD